MQFGKLNRLTLAGLIGVVAMIATACGGGTASTPPASPVAMP
jgi:hypothetical protein